MVYNGKPYFLMDDSGEKTHYFRKHPFDWRIACRTSWFSSLEIYDKKELVGDGAQGDPEEVPGPPFQNVWRLETHGVGGSFFRWYS